MADGALEIEVAGERLLMLPQRALYWPARQMLAIADIHFGKAASFRAGGIPVPRGTTTENLQALDALVPQWVAEAWPLDRPRYVGRDLSWAEWLALPDLTR